MSHPPGVGSMPTKPSFGARAPFMPSSISKGALPGMSGIMTRSLGMNPAMAPPKTPSPGIDLTANPNNNFILQALGGMSPGYNPNYDSKIGTPISNTAAINSQTTPQVGNMPQTNQGIPLFNSSMGRAYG